MVGICVGDVMRDCCIGACGCYCIGVCGCRDAAYMLSSAAAAVQRFGGLTFTRLPRHDPSVLFVQAMHVRVLHVRERSLTLVSMFLCVD